MSRVVFEEGQVLGKSTVVKFNVEPFVTELRCICGNVYRRPNSKISGKSSCGECPRFWILGERFGKWKVTKYRSDLRGSNGASMWDVTCDCGNTSQRDSYNLRKGNTTHCGCSTPPRRIKDITGNKSGKLTALRPTGEKSSNGDMLWIFSCDCGGSTISTIGRFNYGHVKSCGCLLKDNVKNREDYHGMQDTNTYNSWRKMRERCNNPNDILFENYGAVGIKVCDEWNESFLRFYEDMGDCPEGFTIDRVDTSKGYYLENCRWGSRYVQSRNRRSMVGTSQYKGVQYEESSGKWVATISVGKLRSKKIGRYLDEDVAAKSYNLASEMIFGEDNTRLELNNVDKDYSKVNLNCKFFRYWVYEMKKLALELYEED